jgi:hypothetical protein
MLDQLPNPKLPISWPQVWTACWILVLAGWGGLANFWRKRMSGQARPFNLAELAGEICISGFAGVVTYFLATAAGINELVVAALVGISGHAGSRAIFGIEKMLDRKFPMYDSDKDRRG